MESSSKRAHIRTPFPRLDKACLYLANKWFPCSPSTLAEIREILDQPDKIDKELKILIAKDYSLTLFLYKEICSQLQNESCTSNLDLTSPIDLIEATSPDELAKILTKALPTLSLHSVQHSDEYQLKKLEEAFLALITTRELCRSDDIDPDLGAEVSLFRQLGYLLVAWNYPSIYHAAVKNLDSMHSLDDNLISALGFSPTALALSLAEKWGLGALFKTAVSQDHDSLLTPQEARAVAKSVSKLCGIGEKLARANNPDIYPSALHDWEDARKVITAKLGIDGLKLIDQAMSEECEEIFIKSPFIFKPGSLGHLEHRLHKFQVERSISRNPHLDSCGDEMKDKFLELYELIAKGAKSDQSVSFLFKKILPLAGFNCSALFTLDPGTKKLALQLKAGEVRLRQGQNLQELKLKNYKDIVPLAFHSPEVLSLAIKERELQLPSCLAAFFGCSQRFGVFYVEAPHDFFVLHKVVLENRLQALIFALNDCLELN
jgi:hypothetical protein